MLNAIRNALWLTVQEVFLLMLVLWLCALAHAQQNGNLPYVYQSWSSVSLSCGPLANGTCPQNSIRTGDALVFLNNWDTQNTLFTNHALDLNSLMTFTDETAVAGADSNLVSGNFSQQAQLSYAIATGSGADSFGFQFGSPRQELSSAVEIAPPAGGTLVFDSYAAGTTCSGGCPPAQQNQTSISTTTTGLNDVIVCGIAAPPPGSNTLGWSPANNSAAAQFALSTGNVAYPLSMSFGIASANGTQTCIWNIVNSGGSTTNTSYVPFIITLKPGSLTIGTSLLPDGGVGTAYKATLVSNTPFTAAQTWSISAGSCTGLSMSSAGVLSGTPSVAGSCTITAQVTDGTHTTTKAFTFNIATTLQTVFAPVCTTYATTPNGHPIAGVRVGDSLWAFPLEIDTHGNNGQLNPASDMTDDCGDVYSIATPIVGGQQGGLPIYSTKATCSGTISLSQSTPGGSAPTPLAGVFCDIRGAQPIADAISIASSQPSSSPVTLNASSTTPVPNELGICIAALDSSSTAVLNSPCSTVSTSSSFFANVYLGTFPAASAGAFAASATYTSGSNFQSPTTPLFAEFAVRPAAPLTGTFNGEPRRRHIVN